MAKRGKPLSERDQIMIETRMLHQNSQMFILCHDVGMALMTLYAKRPDMAIESLEGALTKIVEDGKDIIYPEARSLAATVVEFMREHPTLDARFQHFRNWFPEKDKEKKP